MIEFLYSVTIAELFIGGGGRLFPIGPITLRMVLFAICMATLVFAVKSAKPRSDGFALSLALLSAYLLTHVPPFVVGLLRGVKATDVLADMQTTLYWFMVPFFALALSKPSMILRSAYLVKAAGVFMSIVYLAVLVALATGYINFFDLYERLDVYSEFVFRGESYFLFKGFLYLGVSLLFFLGTRGSWHGVLLALVTTALILSLTRGYVLATSFAALLMLARLRRWRSLNAGLLVIMLATFLVWWYLPSFDEGFQNARLESGGIRSSDTAYILNNLTPVSLLFGEGFGIPINGRLNIENTYLQVIWKGGLVNLAFWLTPLFLCTRYYFRIPEGGATYRLATAYYFATLLIYVQTATNPYLNNAIGLSFVLISLFSLRHMALAHLAVQRRTGWPRVTVPSAA